VKELSKWPSRKPLGIPFSLKRYPKIEELEFSPSVDDFMTCYFAKRRAVVLRELASRWPALHRWQDNNYLQSIFGNLIFPVELGPSYLADGWQQKQMVFNDFYQDYVISEERNSRPKGYLAQTKLIQQVPQLLNDIEIPIYCQTSAGNNTLDIFAWFGPEGTESPLHTDRKDNIYVQLIGEKLVLIFDATDSHFLYPHQNDEISNSSRVNILNPDLIAYPKFSLATTGSLTILRPGDALFLPKGTWHYVKSLQPSWSLSFWFS
jgi:lysine-specific demethylase 8